MTFNLPLMLQEHGPGTIAEIDRDIKATVEQLGVLLRRRSVIELHLQVQAAADAA